MSEIVDGIVLKLGNKERTIPPLNFKQLRALRPQFETLTNASKGAIPSDSEIEAVVKIAHAALSRNYPDLTTEAVEDMLDIGNMRQVIEAIMGVSGMLREGGDQAGIR